MPSFFNSKLCFTEQQEFTSSTTLPLCQRAHILQKNYRASIPLANQQEIHTLSYSNLKSMTSEQTSDDGSDSGSWEEEKRSRNSDVDSADEGQWGEEQTESVFEWASCLELHEDIADVCALGDFVSAGEASLQDFAPLEPGQLRRGRRRKYLLKPKKSRQPTHEKRQPAVERRPRNLDRSKRTCSQQRDVQAAASSGPQILTSAVASAGGGGAAFTSSDFEADARSSPPRAMQQVLPASTSQ